MIQMVQISKNNFDNLNSSSLKLLPGSLNSADLRGLLQIFKKISFNLMRKWLVLHSD